MVGAELQRRLIVERWVVVIGLPRGQHSTCLGERGEQRLVQTLITQPTNEAFDESVLLWLTGRVRTNTCPVFSAAKTEVFDATGKFCRGFEPKHVRFSSHERPTSFAAARTDAVQYRRHQCALQLADGSGSARHRRRRTARASLSRRGRSRGSLCDGVLGAVVLRPANGRGASVRSISAYYSALSTALIAGGMAALGREEG
jgi:hypothetical protein